MLSGAPIDVVAILCDVTPYRFVEFTEKRERHDAAVLHSP